jgi:hypothetical protein
MRSSRLFSGGRNRVAQLRVECLESRVCPSVSVNTIAIQGGNELQIVGDNNADTINITDQGNGHIDVTNGAGKVLGSADGVTLIKLDGKNGQDTVNYTLANTLTNTEKVVLNLGKKADHATVNLSQGINGANLHLDVEGGAGPDSIGVTLGSLTAAKEHIVLNGGDGADNIAVSGDEANIDAASVLNLGISGGAGADSLTTTFSGQVLGKLNLHTQGNQGADTIVSNVTVDAGSTGIVCAVAAGNKGADDVTLNVNDNSGGDEGTSALSALHAKIFDIGSVDDLTYTDNVTVVTPKTA